MTLKIGVLGSGEGDILEALIKAIENEELDAKIVCVISDIEDAQILEIARKNGIDALFLEYEGEKEVLFDKAVAKEMDKREAELILLLGFMKTLSPWFCKHYENRIINAYPSLLPLFIEKKGLGIYEEVLGMGLKITGCTLHFVTPEYGKGPIIMQVPVEVEDEDTKETLKQKVHEAEEKALIATIKLFYEKRLKIENGKVKIVK